MLFAPSFSRFPRLSRCRGNRSKACFPGRKERKGGLSCLTARQSDRLHRTVQTVPGRRATVFSVRFRGKIRSPGADGERCVGTACQNAVDFRDHDVRRHRLETHRETRVARMKRPADTGDAKPTTVSVPRCFRSETRRTQKPFSGLWKVTRSTMPFISAGGRDFLALRFLGSTMKGRADMVYLKMDLNEKDHSRRNITKLPKTMQIPKMRHHAKMSWEIPPFT